MSPQYLTWGLILWAFTLVFYQYQRTLRGYSGFQQGVLDTTTSAFAGAWAIMALVLVMTWPLTIPVSLILIGWKERPR